MSSWDDEDDVDDVNNINISTINVSQRIPLISIPSNPVITKTNLNSQNLNSTILEPKIIIPLKNEDDSVITHTKIIKMFAHLNKNMYDNAKKMKSSKNPINPHSIVSTYHYESKEIIADKFGKFDIDILCKDNDKYEYKSDLLYKGCKCIYVKKAFEDKIRKEKEMKDYM